MAHPHMPLKDVVEVYRKNLFSVRATAREVYPDIKDDASQRKEIRKRLRRAVEEGLLEEDHFDVPAPSATPNEIHEARQRLSAAHAKKKKKGDWRKPRYIPSVYDGPIILGIFGDPHLDNAGTDLEYFLENLERGNPEDGVFTCCLGDFFDNWPRALAHLYQAAPDPDDAWIVFEDAMLRNPFLFAIKGNHDQFVGGAVNFLDIKMREWGVVMPNAGGHFYLDLGEGTPISVAMRHIWRGNSMYSEAHALRSHVQSGKVEADIVAGGHIHQGEHRSFTRPHDGRVMKLAQVSAFKRLDEYANERGFISADTPPVLWAVCDAREPETSHTRVQFSYDFRAAQALRETQRQKNDFS